jgi:HK97 family phage major capsid protein
MGYFTSQIEKHKHDVWDLVQKQRAIAERAEAENRAFAPEDRAEIDKMNEAITGHETRISDLEKIDAVEGEEPAMVAETNARSHRFSKPMDLDSRDRDTRKSDNPYATRAYREGFDGFLKTGERRDVTIGTQASGGYLVAPVEISDDIVKQTNNLCFVRQKAKIQKLVNAQAYGVRQLTVRMSDPTMMTETASNTADSTMTFARRDLKPNVSSKLVLVSALYLAQAPGADIVSFLNEEFAYKFATLQENKFLNGSGTNEPLGVFTASALGVPTASDVTSGATADFIADDLIRMRYGIKQTYLADPKKCGWVISRPLVQEIRLFKDGQGRYMWMPGFTENAPETILDIPVGVSEYAPAVKTTGSYIAVLGNWDYYRIAEVGDIQIQRLDELYAGTNEVGFLARWYFDGSAALGEAFARLKTG